MGQFVPRVADTAVTSLGVDAHAVLAQFPAVTASAVLYTLVPVGAVATGGREFVTVVTLADIRARRVETAAPETNPGILSAFVHVSTGGFRRIHQLVAGGADALSSGGADSVGARPGLAAASSDETASAVRRGVAPRRANTLKRSWSVHAAASVALLASNKALVNVDADSGGDVIAVAMVAVATIS